MPETSPRIAVVILCFNDGPLAQEAVASIQESEPIELVVDDGSTDPATLAALTQLETDGVRVLRQANGGLAAARMAGAAFTSARYVFPLDADDLAVPGALARLADALDANPQAGMAYGDYAQFGDWEGVFPTPKSFDPWALTYGNPYGACSLLRRSALEQVGGWQLRDGYEDWDLWMAFAEAGWDGVRIDGLAYRRRLHGSRMQGSARKHHQETYRLLQQRHPVLFASRLTLRDDSPLPTLTKLLYPLLLSARQRMNQRLLDLVRDRQPDVAFFFLYRLEFNRSTIKRISEELGVPTLNWFVDDHWRFDRWERRFADIFSAMGLDAPQNTPPCRRGLSSSVGSLGCDRAPGSGSFRQRRARALSRAG